MLVLRVVVKGEVLDCPVYHRAMMSLRTADKMSSSVGEEQKTTINLLPDSRLYTTSSNMSFATCIVRQCTRRLTADALPPSRSHVKASCFNLSERTSRTRHYRTLSQAPAFSLSRNEQTTDQRIVSRSRPFSRPFSSTSRLSHGHLTPPKEGEE